MAGESNVVTLDVVTRLDIPPERILQKALDAKLSAVVICGYDAEGEFYAASSYADGGDALWLLELCKQHLFKSSE